MSFLQTVGKVAVTAVGAVGGALGGGPVGLGIGAVVGAAIDFARSKMAKPAAATAMMPADTGGGPAAPTGPTLPRGVNVLAAQNAVHLMLLGKPAEVQPGAYWLQQFQASAGVPATGKLDPATRTLLIQATAGQPFDAAKLPATTILG